jgi:hypothetical protein
MMETEDLETIFGKEYRMLSSKEKDQIAEFCSNEEEFNQVKHFFSAVENYAAQSEDFDLPRTEIKADLDQLFYETHQTKGILWYNSLWTILLAPEKKFHQKPLIRIAAILILVLSIVPLISNQPNNNPLIAKLEPIQPEKVTQSKSINSRPKSEETVTESISEVSTLVVTDEVNDLQLLANAENTDIPTAEISSIERDQMLSAPSLSVNGAAIVCAPSSATFTNASASIPTAATFKWQTHPDGIYEAKKMELDQHEEEAETRYALLDLLTPSF